MIQIFREDRYSIRIGDFRCRATEEQEQRLRAMEDEELRRFVHIMGGTNALIKAGLV